MAKKIVTAISTPEKYYPVTQSLSIALTPTAKKAEDVAYKIRNRYTGAFKVGIASLAGKRALAYGTEFRAGQTELARAVAKSPASFEFGIIATRQMLRQKGVEADLADMENAYIESNRPKGYSYNKREGGGGGYKKSTKPTKSQADVSALVAELYESPKKSYPIDKDSYKVEFSPNAKGDLYIVKREDGKRYVGRTEQRSKNGERVDPRKRFYTHSTFWRKLNTAQSQGNQLYRDVHEQPEKFSVKLLDSKDFESEDIDQLETGLVEYFENQDPNSTYNITKGGNGGHARSKG